MLQLQQSSCCKRALLQPRKLQHALCCKRALLQPRKKNLQQDLCCKKFCNYTSIAELFCSKTSVAENSATAHLLQRWLVMWVDRGLGLICPKQNYAPDWGSMLFHLAGQCSPFSLCNFLFLSSISSPLVFLVSLAVTSFMVDNKRFRQA